MMSNIYDEVLCQLTRQSKKVTELSNLVEKFEADNTNGEVKKRRRELNNLDQYGRSETLEVHGIPIFAGEDLLNTLNSLAKELNLANLE